MSDQILRRAIGLPGAVLLGLGSILGTGVFVSLGLASGIAGEGVLVALPLAAALALVNGLSSAQLAATFPVAGGTYEYGYRTLGPWAGRAAGWTFLLAKSASMATAARGFAGYLLQGFPAVAWPRAELLAFTSLIVASLLTAGGLKRGHLANAVAVFTTLAGLAAFVMVCLTNEPVLTEAASLPWQATDVVKATAFLFVAYTGYGRIATLGEEVREPARTIPRAVVATLLVTAVVYLAVALAAIHAVGADGFADAAKQSGASLARVATTLAGHPALVLLVVLASLSAMFGVQLNLSLGLSRVVLAMARRGDLPRPLATLTGTSPTPKAAVFAVFAVAALLALSFDIKASWTFSAGTVLVYYALTNLAALRLADEQRRYPRMTAWLGLAACAGLAVTTLWLW